jgi:hypothetical protein
LERLDRKTLGYFVVSILLLGSIVYSTTTYVVVAKKHHSNNDESSDTSNTPLPTVNPSISSKEKNNSPQQTSGSSFDNIKDIKDNQPNYPVVFVNNIVKKMSDSNQLHIMGEVKNVGNIRLGLVEVIATYYDSSNKTIGNDFTNPMPAGLDPQQTAPFDLVVPDFIPANQISSIKWHLTSSTTNPLSSEGI